MHPFERMLSVSTADIELEIRGIKEVAWADFLLNPRKLRGSDFLMRWSQGVWSEKRLIDASNKTEQFYAIPYGPSGTAPTNDVRAFELYFERLEAAGLGNIKRPDLLIFKIADKPFVDKFLKSIGGEAELPFIAENKLQDLISKAIIAVECENSLWIAEKMPDYKTPMKVQKRLGGKLGLAKERPQLVPAFIEDKNGHILPYVKFEGGSLEFTDEALNILKQF